jgi:hypothetical protein
MNRQDAALVPFGQMSEEGWRFWLTVVGARGRAALAAPSSSPPQQPTARAFDAQAETKKLAEAVRDLIADNAS